jgi:uncharacterized protein DUF6946
LNNPARIQDASQKFFVFARGKTIPVVRPEDIIPYLVAREYHWAEGYSAYELSYRWIEAGSIPASVDSVLCQSLALRGIKLIKGFFEFQVGLNTRGHASQTERTTSLTIRLLCLSSSHPHSIHLPASGHPDKSASASFNSSSSSRCPN